MDFIFHFSWLFPVILNIGGETHKSRQIHVRSRQIHVRSRQIHVKSTSDHVRSTSDHVKSTSDHVKSRSDHVVQLTYFCLSHIFGVCSAVNVQKTSQHNKNITDSLDFVLLETVLYLPRCDVICAP